MEVTPRMRSAIVITVLFLLCITDVALGLRGLILCPAGCRCSRLQTGVSTDCRAVGLSSVPIRYIDPDTTHLDLRRNSIRLVREDTFFGLTNLSTLLLDDNRVSDIEPHAFRGLASIVRLSLRRNRVEVLRTDALSGVAGDESACASASASRRNCIIDLRYNDIAAVERNAFAWVRRLSVLLGSGSDDLTIEAYAFYGVRDVPRVEIRDVPSLTLKPRIFTNAENVGAVVVSGTSVPVLRRFTFEGLKNVHRVEFTDCHLGDVQPFAFSGIHYAASPEVTWDATRVTLARSSGSLPSYTIVAATTPEPEFPAGGLVNISECRVDVIPTDAFRDTNLANVVVVDSVVSLVDALAFRGMSRLRVLVFSRSRIGALSGQCFGALAHLRQLLLYDTLVDEIPPYAFKDSEDIRLLSIVIPRNSSLVLRSLAFAQLIETKEFRITGSPHTRLTIEVDAFQSMFGVTDFRIANVTLPVVARNTFRGLGKVTHFRLHNCRVTHIEEAAFGVSYGLGAIDTLDMSIGNALPCNCVTATRMREFERTFSRYTVHCTEVDGRRRPITADDYSADTCQTPSAAVTLLSATATTIVVCLSVVFCYIPTAS
ncbi:hypothetical protein NP493_238g02023 [Ridgeia piscesae]|uniref:Uncharacterized protein n=1 Tax=Ridgeia piscesae TaxID=27915 RepID=A0AAD9UDJ3_RIDPI|nr:hypothetical protein NP493_238g02023 [Ridgeia piscesae]